jgi:hypothetical protein
MSTEDAYPSGEHQVAITDHLPVGSTRPGSECSVGYDVAEQLAGGAVYCSSKSGPMRQGRRANAGAVGEQITPTHTWRTKMPRSG